MKTSSDSTAAIKQLVDRRANGYSYVNVHIWRLHDGNGNYELAARIYADGKSLGQVMLDERYSKLANPGRLLNEELPQLFGHTVNILYVG